MEVIHEFGNKSMTKLTGTPEGLAREITKYVRDKAKSKYDKGTECYICGGTDKLDFHHYNSLSPLLHKWVKNKMLSPEDVLDFREQFIEEHHYELYLHAVTLCHGHHLQLHSIYGKDPALFTAKKQEKWVEIQRTKNGMV